MEIFSKNNPSINIARNWFLLGVVCLALSGLFAILLVGARSPGFQQIMPYKEFFRTALIVHVNLSVFIWLASFLAALWSLLKVNDLFMERVYFGISVAGAVLISASPFLAEGNPLLNNYFPMLQNIYFEIGLGLFAAGILLKNINVVVFGLKNASGVFGFGIYLSALIGLAAFAHYVFTYFLISEPRVAALFNDEDYFNRLFWPAGHILQFAYTQMVIICWFALCYIVGIFKMERAKMLRAILALNFVLVIPSFGVYFFYTVVDSEFLIFFTRHMIVAGGVGTLLAVLAMSYGCFKEHKNLVKEEYVKPIGNNLLWSVILFLSGGFIGLLITQENTKVPAHYHGSIIGISIAVMGLAFYLMPKFGYAEVKGRLARWQGGMYGFGQLMHITGFAISGGYGALRKTPAVMQSFEGKLAMGLMGSGGLVSIIGGLIFVIVIFNSIKNKNT